MKRKGFWHKTPQGRLVHVLGDPGLANDSEFMNALDEMAFAAEQISNKARDKKIWCVVCQDYIARSELKLWSGDDAYHHLCPGCDNDLLPVQTEAEYFGLDEEKDDNGC